MKQVITLGLGAAYTPNATGSYSGGDHVIVVEGVLTGRRKRQAGDALCKKRQRFWQLADVTDELDRGRYATCRACCDLAGPLVVGGVAKVAPGNVAERKMRFDQHVAQKILWGAK